ncbi:hypothetical protein Btru_075712 [Bulinus truncatus]|nr:hypothetical protein Btru_075712 [Bulinus truncatus]
MWEQYIIAGCKGILLKRFLLPHHQKQLSIHVYVWNVPSSYLKPSKTGLCFFLMHPLGFRMYEMRTSSVGNSRIWQP